jgi:hypothetical protein
MINGIHPQSSSPPSQEAAYPPSEEVGLSPSEEVGLSPSEEVGLSPSEGVILSGVRKANEVEGPAFHPDYKKLSAFEAKQPGALSYAPAVSATESSFRAKRGIPTTLHLTTAPANQPNSPPGT